MKGECPICGYSERADRNYQLACKTLFDFRKESTKKLIKTIYQKIVPHVPSDRNVKTMYKFLQKISKVEDNVITRTIDRYMSDGLYLKQYGLAYLGTMILNEGKNRKAAIISEKKRHGSKPPTINLRKQ